MTQQGGEHPPGRAVQEQWRHRKGEQQMLDHVGAEEIVVREIVHGTGERSEEPGQPQAQRLDGPTRMRRRAAQQLFRSADAVDRVVMPLASNPVPAYPRSMAAAGIEANFVVVFVVDSTGRIDRGSLEFPATAQPLFAESVRRALERSRYRPAEMDGRPVRQLVQQEFFFRMEK
jgi:TonB family protein